MDTLVQTTWYVGPLGAALGARGSGVCVKGMVHVSVVVFVFFLAVLCGDVGNEARGSRRSISGVVICANH